MGAKSVIPSSASFHQPRVSLKKNTSDNLPVVILGDSLTPSSSPPTVLVEPPYLWNLWDDSPSKRRNLKTSLSKKKTRNKKQWTLKKKTPSQQTNGHTKSKNTSNTTVRFMNPYTKVLPLWWCARRGHCRSSTRRQRCGGRFRDLRFGWKCRKNSARLAAMKVVESSEEWKKIENSGGWNDEMMKWHLFLRLGGRIQVPVQYSNVTMQCRLCCWRRENSIAMFVCWRVCTGYVWFTRLTNQSIIRCQVKPAWDGSLEKTSQKREKSTQR